MLVGVSCTGLLMLGIGAVPALATTSHVPKYTLKIIEGENTLPEYEQVASTSGSVEPEAPVAVSIVRNGVTVYRDVQENGWASLPEVPQVGETVTLESPVGTPIGSVVYDGLPTIDPTVCAGSTNFSGGNSSGYTVEGYYQTDTPKFDPYGHFAGVKHSGFGEAQVKSLTGTTFGGSFLVPLATGETVSAVESLKSRLANEATYTYISETERPVGACPAPPPPPPPPPAPPVLQGTVFKLVHTTIHELLKLGLQDRVTINQAGTVTQDLYQLGGAIPAYASARKRGHGHKHKSPALLLARGSASASAAGTVKVLLRATTKGKHLLSHSHSHSVRAELITTLKASSGVKLSLPTRTVTLNR